MSRRSTERLGPVPSPPLPADHVLNSGAVLFPGAFDQHGCPLVVFPADGHNKLATELSKAEVVDFINYFLILHNKKQDRDSLVSVVADLRQAPLSTARFIAEALLLLQTASTVHTAYLVQPIKKDVLKTLQKSLAPSKPHNAAFKKVLLKDVAELSNYIDRSQLPPCLGGYFMYHHPSWVAFIKEIDLFLQEFLSVVQRLPSCISTLQSISRLPIPEDLHLLTDFCSTNQSLFLRLRRELGLDELQVHCEQMGSKLRFPDQDPCYLAMAGTPLFTDTAQDMLHHYSRITSAVAKIELLWQQAFYKAQVQLRLLQLHQEALRIRGQMEVLLEEKVQPYRVEVAEDEERARATAAEFEASVYTPAMALVRCSEDVLHTLEETAPAGGAAPVGEPWVGALEALKEKLLEAVEFLRQTLGAQCDFHRCYSKANRWYGLVLRENFLQGLLLGLKEESSSSSPCVSGQRQGRSGQTPAPDPRRKALAAFLRRNPPPALQELVVLAQLAHTLPQPRLQRAGRQVAQRCMTLRKLLISQDTVAFSDLQVAIQWQYDLLSSSHAGPRPAQPPDAAHPTETSAQTEPCPSPSPRSRSDRVASSPHRRRAPTSPGPWRVGTEAGPQQQVLLAMPPPAEGKPSSLSSFDSGFDGAGCSPLEAAGCGGGGGREAWQGLSSVAGLRESFRPSARPPHTHAESSPGALDTEDLREAFDFGSVGNSSRASIQIVPQIKLDSLNFQIKVQRSATEPPQNPWLSLPVDDLESSYTVTITQNPPGQQKAPELSRNRSGGSRNQPTQTEAPASPLSDVGPPAGDGTLPPQSGIEEPALSPIRHLLSSTITDGKDKFDCTTEGNPTLIWDSYDLRDQNHPNAHERTSSSVQDVSMIDWDVRVQEDLRNVEEILERADGILAEEEDVLSQEAMFEDLVRAETHHWELWENEEQLGPMSASELAEAGVLGLDEHLSYPDCQTRDCCPTPTPSSGSESLLDNCYRVEDGRPSGLDLPGRDRANLLPELRNIHILDELILEENLEIHKLRRQVETLEEERRGARRGKKQPSERSGSSGKSKERRAFRHELHKETMEVERMEKSLRQELASGSGRSRKVVKCSALVTFGTLDPDDQELCDELLSGSRRRSQRALQQSLEGPHPDTAGQDSDEHHDEESLNCDLYPLTVDVDETSEPRPTLNLTTVHSQHDREELPPEEGLETRSTMAETETETESGRSDITCKPEASLTPEMGPDDGAFDPGGEPTPPPVPKPRTISLEDTAVPVEIQERPCSAEPTSEPSPPQSPPPCDPPPCDPPPCDPPPCDPPPCDPPKCDPPPCDPPKCDPPKCDPPPCDPAPCDPTPKAPPKAKERKHRPSSGGGGLLGSDGSGHSSSSSNNNNNNHNNNNPLAEDPPGSPGDRECPAFFTTDVTDTEDAAMALVCNGPSQNDPQSLPGDQPPAGLCCSDTPSPPLDTPEEPMACHPRGRSDDCADVEDGFQRSASTRISRTFSPADQPTVKQEDYSEISDFKTPIVLDTGSGVMKAGFADEDLPAVIFPTVIGLPKYEEMMNGSSEREGFIGHDAQHMRGVLALRYPMKNGVIHNWDDMEKIWQHAFRQLCADPEDHPVMLTEAPMSPLHNRQRTVEVMFDRFCVPFVYVAMQAVLALYAAGRCTGVVFDSGDGASHSVPVYEGYSLPHAVQRFPLAGHDVTLHLTKLLQEQGVCMRTSAELEIVREMKERCCRVALDYEAELAPGGPPPAAGREMSYTMPDGQVVCLDTERFRAPEILFRPELIGRDHYGMHESLYKSVLSTDVDLRRELLGNIVLSGGNTLLAGLPERLQREVGRMEPGGRGGRVRVSSPAGRASSVWRGGAALASMAAPAGCAWISREEYEEYGPQIVFRKCF